MLATLSTGFIESDHLADLLPVIENAGFQYLEVVDKGDFNEKILDDLVRGSEDSGIKTPNWHLIQLSPFRKTEAEMAAAIERMKRSMEQGMRIGAGNQVLHWDNRFLDRRMDTLWREIIDQWVTHARGLGVRLLMETVPDKPSNQRYVPCSELFEFVQGYPPEELSVCVDVNHSNLKEDLAEVVQMAGQRLVSLHISDNDGHEEKHWLPGQGVIDFPSFFESLNAIDFHGTMVMEVNPWCDNSAEYSALKKLYEFMETLLRSGKPHPATPPLPAR